MKLNPIMLALSLAVTSLTANAQTTELGPDNNGYKRFLLYPHLQKGFDAMKRGNKSRALTEFEQASMIAPNNAVIATYLAEAYRHFGERERAEVLIKAQLLRNPGNDQLTKALGDLRAKPAPELVLALTLTPNTNTNINSANTTIPTTVTTASKLELTRAQNIARLTRDMTAKRAAAFRVLPNKPKLVAESSQTPPASQAPVLFASVTQGYYFADTAYKASAAGNFSSALPAAREAVRLEPGNRAYGKLLLYVLAQHGGYEEAEAMASKLLNDAVTDGQELIAQRQAIRRRLAFEHFDTANKALHSGDTETAERESRLGVAYAPDLLPHRLQLINTQLVASKLDEANQTASDALGQIQGQPALLVLRGYIRQRLGQLTQATNDFDQAVADKGLTQTELLNFRMIAAHAAMAAGKPKRALALLEPLDTTADEAIGMRKRLASSASKRSLYPDPMKSPVLPSPVVICTASSFTPACDVWPGEEPADPAMPVAVSAYKAFGMRDYAVAAVKASEAVELSPANPPYRLLLVNALVADGKLQQADQHATRFIQMHAEDAEMLAARSALRQRLGQRELAKDDAAAALLSDRLSLASEVATLIQLDRKPQARERVAAAIREGLLNDQTDTNVAYLAILVGDDEGALAAFDRANARGTLPNTAAPDAAYAAGRLGRNDQTLKYFRQTIDVAEVGQPFLTPQQLFNTRREVADRSRQWGANAALTYRGISPSALAATQSGASNDSLQAGIEAWWRPFDYRDGRVLELYTGLAETLSSKAGFATGAESLQGTLGARVKPLVDVNLVLAIERRFAIGSKTTTDLLPRLAYSAGTGTDLRVDAPSWMTATVYTETGRFIKQRQTYATFEGQLGRSFRLDAFSPKLVVFPHAVLGADYNSNAASGSKNAVGAGAGVTLRHWLNEDRYNAPRSYADLSLQYRARISGDDRAKGVFLRATFSF
jgi:bacteriophage N4 adsorption protein A